MSRKIRDGSEKRTKWPFTLEDAMSSIINFSTRNQLR